MARAAFVPVTDTTEAPRVVRGLFRRFLASGTAELSGIDRFRPLSLPITIGYRHHKSTRTCGTPHKGLGRDEVQASVVSVTACGGPRPVLSLQAWPSSSYADPATR